MDDWIIRLVNDTGYWGVGFLMFVETVFPPVPSEVIMTVAGVSAARGNVHFGGVVASGTVGAMLGNYLWFLLAIKFGKNRLQRFLEKHGRWLTLHWTEVERGQKLFSKHGSIIVLIDGEIAGAINRRPGEGEFRSNMAVGGSAEATELTPREREICAAMGPRLKELGLIFVGIDVIGGEWLTEINVTSPTGIIAIDGFNGTDTPGMIWDAIESKLR